MSLTPQLLALLPQEQFRMARLQVYNWGTFGGRHDIPVAARGLLIIGPSGSGKSTLLDAVATLLVPPRWLDYNAAAREGERSGRDRSLMTYLRGAWAEQTDEASGGTATRFLRPGTTWSALALTYRTPSGQAVSLAQVFWLRGGSTHPADVRRLHLVLERDFDLRELEGFPAADYDVRWLRQALPDAFVTDEFGAYRERFCRLLGIESELALRLLHKTQSAKNLGDLNALLRDFMLDRPDTFAAADRLVAEFAELNAAHQAVVTAREQVETLAPARARHEQLQGLRERRAELEALRRGLEVYRELRRHQLLERRLAELEARAEGCAGEVARCQAALANEEARRRDLEARYRALGGDHVARWEAERRDLEQRRAEILTRRDRAAEACRRLGWVLPDTPTGFAQAVGAARRELEEGGRQREADWNRLQELSVERSQAERELAAALRELEVLRRQRSNIPADMLDLRREVAAALGVAEQALPFVGELLEVKPEEAAWRGAIERVLRGFALSLLVEERYYQALANHVNARHLGRRLVYYRTGRPASPPARPLPPASLVLKLEVREGPHRAWLEAQLRERFDYACVESVAALRAAERAVTREGQVKHGPDRHEKDDRHPVDDPARWVLGWDNRAKRALFEERVRTARERLARLEAAIGELKAREEERGVRVQACQVLVNLRWQEIDAAPVLERLAALADRLREAREGDPELRRLAEELQAQEARREAADEALRAARVARDRVHEELAATRRRLEQCLRELAAAGGQAPGAAAQGAGAGAPADLLPPARASALEERFSRLGEAADLDNLDKLAHRVDQGLTREMDEVQGQIVAAERAIEGCFAEFKRRWPAEAGDVDATLASAPDFLARLARLEADGLPAYEQRFFDLLRTQSTQNLTALNTHLAQARKAIHERMELVNESLARVEFNPGTHLRIEVSDRHLPEVREFRQEVQAILSHAWTEGAEDREATEARFLALRRLVERLGSQDPEQRRWREAVLDVRQHVEFIARELDERGAEIEVYRSGAGKSGGQRQKLATTCLAAALRYQLGGADRGLPVYAPVVLDEAFDKADHEFTALAMRVFLHFGFQMIVATPLKSVMTLEPFVGGACYVDIRDRRSSGVLPIEYDEERGRLDLPARVREEAAVEAP